MEDERSSSLPGKFSLCIFGLLLVLSWSAEVSHCMWTGICPDACAVGMGRHSVVL